MESSLPVSELELEARSAISKRAEANPALFLFSGLSGLCPNSERKERLRAKVPLDEAFVRGWVPQKHDSKTSFPRL
jgi:hypothetical protein